jgi:ribonuclease VapC
LIVVDTSALMAILLSEDDKHLFLEAIVNAQSSVISAPTQFELHMVATGRLKREGVSMAQQLLESLDIEIVDWTEEHSQIASTAFLNFGKGRHKAALNFGDCMAYAVAKSLDAPLLFKGEDFVHTDIRSAL